MNEDENKVPQDGQTTEDKVPSTPDGQTQETEGEAPKQSVPDNLQGKSTTDLVKMYGELERKLGEHSSELGESRKFKQEMGVVLQAIYSDPNLTEAVKKEILKISGQETKPDEDKKPTSSVSEDSIKEIRRVQEQTIMKGFEDKYGFSGLDSEKKQEAYNKVGDALLNLLDPGGKKSRDEVLDSIDLTRLPYYLDNAYYLANRDGELEKAGKEGMARAMQNRGGMIGGIPSSGSVSSSDSLTTDEREVARKMGISDQDYLKNKKELREQKGE